MQISYCSFICENKILECNIMKNEMCEKLKCIVTDKKDPSFTNAHPFCEFNDNLSQNALLIILKLLLMKIY